jgi:glycosyltransferase involved in cell wall biosynthesis
VRIGIDARLVGYRRGIGNYVYHLIQALAKTDSRHEFITYVASREHRESLPSDPRFIPRVLRLRNYVLDEQIALPVHAARDQLDILHCPANTGPLIVPTRTRLVLTIHDVIYMLPRTEIPSSASVYQRAGAIYRRLVVPRAARGAAAIVTDSAHSAADVARHLQLARERIKVIHMAAGENFSKRSDKAELERIRRSYGLGARFVLALGGVDPRKNTAGVIEAFRLFLGAGDFPHQLIIVGLPPAEQTRLRRNIRRAGLDHRAILAGFVPEDDLIALYSAAEMFLYPSFYEGFGLPVLEAMASGTPVVTSPVGSIPEIAGAAAVMAYPKNIGAIAEQIRQVVSDSGLRERLVALGFERAAKFSWYRTAQQMLQVYEECAEH